MAINDNRSSQIRKTTFGIDMRKPIADGIEANVKHPDSSFTRAKKSTDTRLNNTKVEQEEGLDKHKDANIKVVDGGKQDADEDLDRISEECGYRVASCETSKISGKEEYYTLVLSRENGT